MPKTKTSNKHVLALWQAVHNLSLSAREQVAVVRATGDGCSVDELALDFDDYRWLFDEAGPHCDLTKAELLALRSLDRQLDQMSGEANSDLWTVKAIRNFDCWEEVRRLAAAVLLSRSTGSKQLDKSFSYGSNDDARLAGFTVAEH